MCGIFALSYDKSQKSNLAKLISAARRRGKDSSGLVIIKDKTITILKGNQDISLLKRHADFSGAHYVLGHSRLITNGNDDNQPVIGSDTIVLHNGIVVNETAIWDKIGKSPKLQVDTETISAFFDDGIAQNTPTDEICQQALKLFAGTVNALIILPARNELVAFSNHGSLYRSKHPEAIRLFSEAYPLKQLFGPELTHIKQDYEIIRLGMDITNHEISMTDVTADQLDFVTDIHFSKKYANLPDSEPRDLRRCTKCILPETMPYISFDEDGVCNYCANYKTTMDVKPIDELRALIEPFRRAQGNEVIVPFSGGRDSCYGLHLIVEELGMRPVTYTYDWGMVTDLARRNISRMCSQLGVENIIIAADIKQKRDNIKKNFLAWLKNPDLGMVSILTAGDKHFFRYLKDVQKETGISLNLWGTNPMETTHFKSGFLGVPPSFASAQVYSSGWGKQLDYQSKRFAAMRKSKGYFNASLFDTLSGEYYRSISSKADYHHIFDYWQWIETDVDDCLINQYDWETSPDSLSTWRIGDGTAAMYNYIYYTMAGFTEHDTFRSNQIREGHITRDQAMQLIHEENQPRWANIEWYCNLVDVDFRQVVDIVASAEKVTGLTAKGS